MGKGSPDEDKVRVSLKGSGVAMPGARTVVLIFAVVLIVVKLIFLLITFAYAAILDIS